MLADELKSRLQSWIDRERPLLVILFGSALTGLPGPEADLDLAVFFGRRVRLRDVINGLSQALARDDIDLMVLDHADPIARMTASNGMLLYEAEPGCFARFASLAVRQFMDTEKFRRARRELTDELLGEKNLQ